MTDAERILAALDAMDAAALDGDPEPVTLYGNALRRIVTDFAPGPEPHIVQAGAVAYHVWQAKTQIHAAIAAEMEAKHEQ